MSRNASQINRLAYTHPEEVQTGPMTTSAMAQTDARNKSAQHAGGKAQAWRRRPRRHLPIEQMLAIVN